MLQYIAITIVGIAVILYLIRKLFSCAFRKKKENNPCDSCAGCILHPKNKEKE
ncbi:FeoB-associated Cys-rich membrane protein [Bacteroidales bacterium OttesenSCG-928-M11]|nr:FeoB-associated Cys-rich membrane protein [Bacteroidales bacterium OttesenSCG-928-M11]